MYQVNFSPFFTISNIDKFDYLKNKPLIGSAILVISGLGIIFLEVYAGVNAKIIVTTGVLLVVSSVASATHTFWTSKKIASSTEKETMGKHEKEKVSGNRNESQGRVSDNGSEVGNDEDGIEKEKVQEETFVPPIPQPLEVKQEEAEREKEKEKERDEEQDNLTSVTIQTHSMLSPQPCRAVPRRHKRKLNMIDRKITEHLDAAPNFYEECYRHFNRDLANFFKKSFSSFFASLHEKREKVLRNLEDRPPLTITFVGGGFIGLFAAIEAYQKGASIHFFNTESKETPLFYFREERVALLRQSYHALINIAEAHKMIVQTTDKEWMTAEGGALEEMFLSLLSAISEVDDHLKVYPTAEGIRLEGQEVKGPSSSFRTDWIVGTSQALPTSICEEVGKQKPLLKASQVITTAIFTHPWGNHPQLALLQNFPAEATMQAYVKKTEKEAANKKKTSKKLDRKVLWKIGLSNLKDEQSFSDVYLGEEFGKLEKLDSEKKMPITTRNSTVICSPYRGILDFEWSNDPFLNPTSVKPEFKERLEKHWVETSLKKFYPQEVVEVLMDQQIKYDTGIYAPVTQLDKVVLEKEGMKLFLIGNSATHVNPLTHDDTHSLLDAMSLAALVFTYAYNPQKMEEMQKKHENGMRERALSLVSGFKEEDDNELKNLEVQRALQDVCHALRFQRGKVNHFSEATQGVCTDTLIAMKDKGLLG